MGAAADLVGAASLGGSWGLDVSAADAVAIPPLTPEGMAGYGAVLESVSWAPAGNTGTEGGTVNLSPITGSWSTLTISGIPVGAVLTDGNGHTFTATSGHTSVNVTGWRMSTLAIKTINDANFTLTAKTADGHTATDLVTVAPTAATETWAPTATGVEGSTIALGALAVTVTGKSGDSNVLNTLTISGAPVGAILSDGHGHTATSTGAAINVMGWTLSSLTIKPLNAGNFTLTATATEKDAEGNVSAATTVTEAVTVTPTAATETWAPAATGVEGSTIALGALAVTVTGKSGDSNVLNTLTISGAPAGAILSDGHGHTATSTGAAINVMGWTLSSLTIKPLNAGNFTLTATATEKDASGDVSAPTSVTETVQVLPLAPTLNVAPVTGTNDGPIAMHISAVAAGLSGDHNTLTSLVVSGLPIGTILFDRSGHVFVALPFSTSVNILGWDLNSLSIYTGASYSGITSGESNFALTVTATEKDSAGDTNSTTALATVTVVPDAPTINAPGATGVEGSAIALHISVQGDGNDTLASAVISAIPIGAVLKDGNGHTFTATSGHTSVDVSGWNLSNLTITPTNDHNFALTVTGTVKDQDGDISAATTTTQTITVNPVAPTVAPVAATGAVGTPIALHLGVTVNGLAGDSNNLASLVVSSIPVGAVLKDGAGHSFTATAGHTSVDVSGWTLSGLTVTPTAATNFVLSIAATEKDAEGNLSTTTTGTEAVTVTSGVNHAPSQPVDSNAAANSVSEGAANGTVVGITAASSDIDGNTVTYSLTNNAGGRFAINASTGVVTVANSALLDYESAPGHAYSITVQASDGTLTSSQTFSIAVTDVAPLTPTDSNAATNTISEGAANGTVVGITAASSDVNGGTVTYSLTNNAGGRFAINASTGVVTVANSALLDYESASGHAYSITVQASDGTLTSSQTFSIAVTDIAPLTPTDSNAAANSVSEGAANGTVVGITAASSDVNGGTVTYSLTDNAGGRFAINASTGVVTVANSALLDYESASGHAYSITVQASDGTLTSSQTFSIAVTDVAPLTPTDSNAATNTISEGAANGTVVGITAASSDVHGGTVTYSLTDNAGGRFAINASTGVVTVANSALLDYESASGHAYSITVQASDGTLTSSQTFSIAVTDVAPLTPTDSNAATNTISEGAANGTVVGITAASSDVHGGTVTYSLTDNAGGRFAINASTGVVTVANGSLLNYASAPGHAYSITVQASDGSLTSSQTFSIAVTAVTAVNHAPSQPTDSNAAANTISEGAANGTAVGITAASTDVDGNTVTYSLTDNAGGRFAINASTGVVTVANSALLDYESAPGHAYSITVQASDGTLTSSQTFAITVTNVNDNAPVITSNGGGTTASVSIAENTTAVTTVTATDADGALNALTYSISGGADVAKFSIDASTGVLTFLSAPNFEAPTDVGANNVYDVTVQVSDGTNTDTQAIAVTVTNVNDSAPVITSNGGGTSASVSVAENATAVTTVTATDADSALNTLTYSISGGADAAKFSIDASTGVLTFVSAPDFEAPTDAGTNNVYDVTVQVSDGTNTDTQAIAITVTNVNDNTPIITSNGAATSASVSVAENATAVTTVTATDADGALNTLTYSISGGADAAKFSINASTGVLTFVSAPDFEAPTDAGANNVYDVTVQVSDGTNTDTQAIAVTVTNVNDNAPVITSNGGGTTASVSIAENTTAVTTVTATDADGAPTP